MFADSAPLTVASPARCPAPLTIAPRAQCASPAHHRSPCPVSRSHSPSLPARCPGPAHRRSLPPARSCPNKRRAAPRAPPRPPQAPPPRRSAPIGCSARPSTPEPAGSRPRRTCLSAPHWRGRGSPAPRPQVIGQRGGARGAEQGSDHEGTTWVTSVGAARWGRAPPLGRAGGTGTPGPCGDPWRQERGGGRKRRSGRTRGCWRCVNPVPAGPVQPGAAAASWAKPPSLSARVIHWICPSPPRDPQVWGAGGFCPVGMRREHPAPPLPVRFSGTSGCERCQAGILSSERR